MIDKVQMRKLLDTLPWPKGTKPVLVTGHCEAHGFVVNLHDTIDRGWTDIAKISGPTPERCLALALTQYIEKKGINNDPRFFDAIRRLSN